MDTHIVFPHTTKNLARRYSKWSLVRWCHLPQGCLLTPWIVCKGNHSNAIFLFLKFSVIPAHYPHTQSANDQHSFVQFSLTEKMWRKQSSDLCTKMNPLVVFNKTHFRSHIRAQPCFPQHSSIVSLYVYFVLRCLFGLSHLNVEKE